MDTKIETLSLFFYFYWVCIWEWEQPWTSKVAMDMIKYEILGSFATLAIRWHIYCVYQNSVVFGSRVEILKWIMK